MSGAFTPGPWAVHRSFPSLVVPAAQAERPVGGASDDAVDLETYAQEIVGASLPQRHRPKSETLANLTLCAAAPDMFEALSKMLEHYVSLVNCGDCGNWNPEEEPEVIAARSALAKAQGAQS